MEEKTLLELAEENIWLQMDAIKWMAKNDPISLTFFAASFFLATLIFYINFIIQ